MKAGTSLELIASAVCLFRGHANVMSLLLPAADASDKSYVRPGSVTATIGDELFLLRSLRIIF